MQNQEISSALKQAFKSFQLAESELNRPFEDLVTICACEQMRISAQSFLQSFMLSKSVDIIEEKHFDDMLRYCKRIDSQFNAIDLSCFACQLNDAKNIGAKYCLSPQKVGECFTQTKMLKNLICAKLNISEKDFE